MVKRISYSRGISYLRSFFAASHFCDGHLDHKSAISLFICENWSCLNVASFFYSVWFVTLLIIENDEVYPHLTSSHGEKEPDTGRTMGKDS